jgi:hypothetical protein
MLLSRSIRLPRTSLPSLSFLRPSRFFSNSRPRLIIEMGTVNTTERLSQLRQLMKEHKVDVYSMLLSLPFEFWKFFHTRTMLIAVLKLSPQRIATSPSTLRHATAAEVSDRHCPALASPVTHYLINCRIHLGFLGLRWHRDHLLEQSCSLHRRAILQPSREAAG